ncbi:DUF6456 domain-containing protein [Chthonobacter albigriseus]|uniref:DUF6456 domain-containing protein n=1 Tax=Chthonobacter albigriseus TaxID=1683161 RepID=UPI0015EFDC0E|nr:DUF6456 domain-containing protein [Chthonobacter albigriseus]
MKAARSRPPASGTVVRCTISDRNGRVEHVEVDLAESPLAWLRSHRGSSGDALIEDSAFVAGERFRRDFTIAGLMARTTMNWDALGGPNDRRQSGSGGGLVVTDAALAARARVTAALQAVGPDLAAVLIDVCCHLRGLGDVERSRGYPSRSAKVVLRIALAALARHYGLCEQATGPAGARLRHWGAPDYRPRA